MKSGNINLLETSGPFQACNGTDLPLVYNSVLDDQSVKNTVN